MMVWATFQLVVTLIILFFVTEDSNKGNDDDEEEIEVSLGQAIPIFGHIIAKKEIQTYFLFVMLSYPAIAFSGSLSQVYLTDQLKFPVDSISKLMLISGPANIVFSILSGYLTSKSPFRFMFLCTIGCIFISAYQILVLIKNFP
jgi:predicted MFS family arabinose efflux permease